MLFIKNLFLEFELCSLTFWGTFSLLLKLKCQAVPCTVSLCLPTKWFHGAGGIYSTAEVPYGVAYQVIWTGISLQGSKGTGCEISHTTVLIPLLTFFFLHLSPYSLVISRWFGVRTIINVTILQSSQRICQKLWIPHTR